MGLTGAVTVGLFALLVFGAVGLVVVVVTFVAFLSAVGSGGFARGAVALTGGFAGRFSVLK